MNSSVVTTHVIVVVLAVIAVVLVVVVVVRVSTVYTRCRYHHCNISCCWVEQKKEAPKTRATLQRAISPGKEDVVRSLA